MSKETYLPKHAAPTPNHLPLAMRVTSGVASLAILTGCGAELPGLGQEEQKTPNVLPAVAVEKIVDAKTFIAADKVAYPYKDGYMRMQGDAVNSFSLSDGRVVTLRSDTYVFTGEKDEAGNITEKKTSFPRNTAACYDPKTSTMTALNKVGPSGKVESFFPREISETEKNAFVTRKKAAFKKNGSKLSENELENLAVKTFNKYYPSTTYEWQSSGFSVGNKVYAFSLLMESKKGINDPWNFEVVGTKLHIMDFGESGCDTVTFEKTVDTPATAEGPAGIMWGAGSVYDKKANAVYILGNKVVQSDPWGTHDYYAAKVPLENLADASTWQYFKGSEFSVKNDDTLQPIIPASERYKDAIDLKFDPQQNDFVLTATRVWAENLGGSYVMEQRGKTVLEALLAHGKRASLNIAADPDRHFAYLPTKNFVETDSNTFTSFDTISLNNVKDKNAIPMYGIHELHVAESLDIDNEHDKIRDEK